MTLTTRADGYQSLFAGARNDTAERPWPKT